MPNLADYLSLEQIKVGVKAQSWQGALKQVGSLLAQGGIAGESYTHKMIDNVTENGPYIVITPGFAFAHARSDDSVQQTGMALIKLKDPVKFGHATNDPVGIVLALAATDNATHQNALAQLAKMLSNPQLRQRLEDAQTREQILDVFESAADLQKDPQPAGAEQPGQATSQNKNLVLTVCGNGLGTSLFLKNTLEQVLDRWGWSPYLTVEATDTISARGRAGSADFILTSGEIAKTLGEVPVPVKIIEDFTSQVEIDRALRDLYDV